MTTRAVEIIKLQQREEDRDANFRSRWQDTADHMFPRESFITETLTPGVIKADRIYDTTGMEASKNMSSGLIQALVPAGQEFFGLTVAEPELQDIDDNKSYLNTATRTLHQELFRSNFLLQLAETIRSLIIFGTGNLFSDFRVDANYFGLNFMDWDISRYQILENFHGIVDTNILKFPKTAMQAFRKWGDKVGKSVLEAMKSDDTKKQQDVFWFIHIVRPRERRNPRFEDGLNMPLESIYVNIKDEIEMDEGGFPEFPYHIPRWSKTTGETHGRGIGTDILSQVRKLQQMERSYIEVGNILARPHREIISSFEGEYNTTPDARNDVLEIPSSYVDERNLGNYFTTKDALVMERKVVLDAFYDDAFAPITSSGPGDRRNELEIRQRIIEAFMKIGSPIARLQHELFDPLITRCYLLLVKNHIKGSNSKQTIEPPPASLKGGTLKIVYRGPMAAALESSEITASERWLGMGAALAEQMPELLDNISVDKAYRRMGRVLGVNEEDIASEEEVAAKREARQRELQIQRQLEMAQMAASAYGQTTKAPEEGSGAEQLQEALS